LAAAGESLAAELKLLIAETGNLIGASVPRTLGDVGAGVVAANVKASLLIFQASLSAVGPSESA
jgi:hypothetical protein